MGCCGNGGACCSTDDTVQDGAVHAGCACGGGGCHDDGDDTTTLDLQLSPEQMELLTRLVDDNSDEDLTDEEIEKIREMLFSKKS